MLSWDAAALADVDGSVSANTLRPATNISTAKACRLAIRQARWTSFICSINMNVRSDRRYRIFRRIRTGPRSVVPASSPASAKYNSLLHPSQHLEFLEHVRRQSFGGKAKGAPTITAVLDPVARYQIADTTLPRQLRRIVR